MKARLLTAFCVTAAIAVVEGQSDVPYPTGYRDWSHIKSMVIEEGHPLFEAFGGIHHIYANDEAVTGYQAGRFPDGAVIAFDLLEAVRADNAVTEGARQVLGVMHKDSERYPATGGWGFEGFGGGDAGNRVVGANAATGIVKLSGIAMIDPQHTAFATGLEPIILGVGQPDSA